jgi:hypothetical protein
MPDEAGDFERRVRDIDRVSESIQQQQGLRQFALSQRAEPRAGFGTVVLDERAGDRRDSGQRGGVVQRSRHDVADVGRRLLSGVLAPAAGHRRSGSGQPNRDRESVTSGPVPVPFFHMASGEPGPTLCLL